MPKFSFTVDRLYRATAPIRLSARLDGSGEAIALAPGDEVVYRGLVELAGVAHYTFERAGVRCFTRDRAQLDGGLDERYDELLKV